MTGKSRLNKDSLSGLMFIAFGFVGLWLGRDYEVGTAIRMGPGYLPNVLCWGVVFFGVIVATKGLLFGGDALEETRLRPVLLVLASIAVFAALIVDGGLILAVLGCVLVAASGGDEFKFTEALLLGAALSVGSSALFVYGLGLPMNIWPNL